MIKHLNCVIPGLEKFILGTELKECTNKNSARHAFEKFLDIKTNFSANVAMYGCSLPCTTVSFGFDVFTIHRNSWIDTNDEPEVPLGVFQFRFYFSLLEVEESVVTLVYDLETLLASLGGNLGLFLGFSCLSVMISLLQMLKRSA